MSKESWKQIKNYPNYFISNHGNVKNQRSPLIKSRVLKDGNPHTILYEGKKQVKIRISTLVFMTFSTEWYPENLGKPKCKYRVKHIDQNVHNCHINNLELITLSEARKRMWAKKREHQLRTDHNNITYNSIQELCDQYNQDPQTYLNHLKNGLDKHQALTRVKIPQFNNSNQLADWLKKF